MIRLIDVGARGGIDKRWEPYYNLLEVRAFEPDPEECTALNSKQYPYAIKFIPVALGAQDGKQATLFVCRNPGCSSLLPPNQELCLRYPYGEYMEVVSKKEIKIKRMDIVCRHFEPDVIKIDTQGTELDILIGSGRLLDCALAVELEVGFVQQYIGQVLFSEVDSFMRQQGFTLRGLRRTFWREKAKYLHPYGGQIFHGDALYLKPDKMDCRKGHVILAAYRQYDMLAHFGADHMIPEESWLIQCASRLLSRYSNRELRRFIDRLCPKCSTDWHDPDFF